MFCYQCEQTAGCKGCTGHMGVCGKKADTAEPQDRLTGFCIRRCLPPVWMTGEWMNCCPSCWKLAR